MAEAFPVSGDIDPATFPYLLVHLHRSGATGSLKVSGPVHPKALYFRAGRILFGSSNDSRDQLGSILIESGRISREQLDDVNAKVGPGNPLAKVLRDSGFVNERELGDAARTKVERILADVLSWDAGLYEFEDGVLPKGAVDLKLSTERLLLAAVQRVDDRAFALRHVDLSTVVAPTADADGAISEIRGEVWPLLERLDGRRSLKDAIAMTRLDEFEAAKIACALLFLGAVQKLEQVPAEELDLAQEAQIGFAAPSEDPEPPMFTVPLQPVAPPAEATGFAFAEPEPPPVPDYGAPEPLPSFVGSDTAYAPPPPAPAGEPSPAETVVFPIEGPPEPEVVPIPEPEPLYEEQPQSPTLDATALLAEPLPAQTDAPEFQAPSEEPAVAPVRAVPPVAPPATSPPAAPPPGPTQEDLAALDALLHPGSRGQADERPAPGSAWEPDPLETPPPRPRAPQPPRRTPVRAAAASSSSSSRLPLVIAAVAGVLLTTLAAWYFMLRSPVKAPQVPPATVAHAPTPAPPVATVDPAAAAGAGGDADTATTAAAAPEPAAAPTGAPTPLPIARPTPLPPRPAPLAAAAEARALLGQQQLDEAAAAFSASLSSSSRNRYSLQVLTACSPETVQKAVAATGSEQLFVLPIRLKGRDCYRVCWGVFDDRGAAEAAVASVPEYFRQGGARPRLSTIAELLP